MTEVTERGKLPQEWWEKMVHDVPDAPVVDRAAYLIKEASGKRILDVGGTGPMADRLRKVAGEYHSLDKQPSDAENHHVVDLDNDNFSLWDYVSEVDIVIMGEVLEHLSNPGYVLDTIYGNIQGNGITVILTVPNCGNGPYKGGRGQEIVNGEHVAWYSYHTLKTLVERHGFRILEWFWYNGKPYTAEGLIFHMEPA